MTVLTDKLRQEISSNQLSPDEAGLLMSVVDVLGSNAAEWVLMHLDTGDFGDPENKPHYYEWISKVRNLNGQVATQDLSSIKAALDEIVSSPDYEFGRELLPWVYDVIEYLNHNSQNEPFTKSLKGLLFALEYSFIRNISLQGVKGLVGGGLISCIRSRPDVLADFRFIYYVEEPEYDGGEWGKQFVPLIEHNQEQLGERVVIEGKDVAPTVERWLQEYSLFSGKPGPQRGALDRLKFVEESPNGKALSKEDKQVLLKLCELYDWFTDPFVTEAELAEFEDISPGEQRPGLVHEAVDSDVEADDEAEEIELDVPGTNVQGVLVQTPLGVSARSGLEVAGDTAAPVSEAPEPTLSMPVKSEPQPVVLPKQAPPVLNMDKVRQEADAKKKAMQAEIDAKLQKLKGRN